MTSPNTVISTLTRRSIMIEIGFAVMLVMLAFFIGLFMGAVVLGLAMAASREDDSRGR